MRIKEPRLVVTFHTTASAMAAEQLCQKKNLPGKLISVPRCLTSDCGIAWSAPLELRKTVEEAFHQADIETDGFHEVLL